MSVSLHLGDWRDVFETWPNSFVMICDPPYGVGWRRTGSGCWRNNQAFINKPDRGTDTAIANDKSTAERDAAMVVIGVRAAASAVFGPHRIDRVPPWGDPREILYWDKGGGAAAGDVAMPWKPCVETIAIYGKGWTGHRDSCILRAAKIAFSAEAVHNGRVHPNEKPLSIVLELVRKAPPGLPIVDPFAGSGVVGSACILEERDYFGAEIDPKHHATASDRLGITHGPLFPKDTNR